jgi:F-type H+-transporting ATPase subunit a
MSGIPEISLRAEEIFHIGSFTVTNAVLLSVLTLVVLAGSALFIRFKFSAIPGKVQSIFELLIEQALKIMDTVFGERKLSEKYLPIVATIFLFVLTSNWLGLFPFVGSIKIAAEHGGELIHIPLFRSPASDLNFTLILALISVSSVNILGILAIGFKKHLAKFFHLGNPFLSFAGILEFISEFVKIISFSFRLFGNVFAGEILLVIIGFLVPYIVPLPFLFLEVFVGLIQAFIFSMLTLVFIGTSVRESH